MRKKCARTRDWLRYVCTRICTYTRARKHDTNGARRRGANERVYVSPVADRVNVGKDERLRFSGWTEGDEAIGSGREEGGRETEEKKKFCALHVSVHAWRCAWLVYLCDTLRIRVNDT